MAKKVVRRGDGVSGMVDVSLQSGLHYPEVAKGTARGAAPRPGEPLPAGGGDGSGGIFFVPLCRDGTDGGCHFSVRIQQVTPSHGVAASGGTWDVEVSSPLPANVFETVTFVAGTEGEARWWDRQLAMRAAPATVVWSKVLAWPGRLGERTTWPAFPTFLCAQAFGPDCQGGCPSVQGPRHGRCVCGHCSGA